MSGDAERIAAGLTKSQRAIITDALGAYDDFGYYNFRDAGERAGLSAEDASVAIRGMIPFGIVTYSRGLLTEDGEVYGAGYALNADGLAARNIINGGQHGE